MSDLPRDQIGSISCRVDSIRCQCEQQCRYKRKERTSRAVFSLYPSRASIESVRIPSCAAVFADADRRRKLQRGKKWHKETLYKNEKEASDELDTKSFASCFLHESKSVPPPHSSSEKEAHPTPRSKASVVFPGVGRGSNIPARLRSKALWSSSSQRGVDHQHFIPPDSSSVTSTSVTSVTSVHSDATAHSFHNNKTAPPPRTELEVSPGVFLPLYGAKETMAAFDSGSLIPASCMICEMDLQCVEAAEYVLCPVCKVVSPVLNGSSTGGNGAVGLGMAVSA